MGTLVCRLFLLHVKHVGHMGKCMVDPLSTIYCHSYRPLGGLASHSLLSVAALAYRVLLPSLPYPLLGHRTLSDSSRLSPSAVHRLAAHTQLSDAMDCRHGRQYTLGPCHEKVLSANLGGSLWWAVTHRAPAHSSLPPLPCLSFSRSLVGSRAKWRRGKRRAGSFGILRTTFDKDLP